jgi:hypothetical protein
MYALLPVLIREFGTVSTSFLASFERQARRLASRSGNSTRELVNIHDFIDRKLSRAGPFGVPDITTMPHGLSTGPNAVC